MSPHQSGVSPHFGGETYCFCELCELLADNFKTRACIVHLVIKYTVFVQSSLDFEQNYSYVVVHITRKF
jgi:hypothetical protein